jgi:hypothetical protein
MKLAAMTRKPSCLISCSHSSPEGGRGADLGRHSAMKPAGRARGRKGAWPPSILDQILVRTQRAELAA